MRDTNVFAYSRATSLEGFSNAPKKQPFFEISKVVLNRINFYAGQLNLEKLGVLGYHSDLPPARPFGLVTAH